MGNITACAQIKHEYDLHKLLKMDKDSLDYFTLNGYSNYGKVVDVYDGDTCSIIMSWEGKYRKFKCRCYGYDSPEMKPRLNVENREEIINKAKAAKERFKELTDEIVCVKCLEFDKYGRLLVNIYKNNTHINNTMVKEGHGYVYHGGTKH